MKRALLSASVIAFFLAVMIEARSQDEPEHPQITVASDEFLKSLSSSLETLRKADFENGLETPGLGSMSEGDFEKLVNEIRKETPIREISEGERGVKYDVILQPGHYGRQTGRVGTTGKWVSERALAAYITNLLAQRLRSYGDSVLVISADQYIHPSSNGSFDGLRSKVFLAIHLEGSEIRCHGKASIGYPKGSLPFPMHTVGLSLADALGYNYTDFAHDNFTPNEASYYMFSQVRADRLTGLLEVGELTCPDKEKQIISSSNAIGQNIAYALNYLVKTPR
jgi:N-acetylmuramoyl-L-alanine amidase